MMRQQQRVSLSLLLEDASFSLCIWLGCVYLFRSCSHPFSLSLCFSLVISQRFIHPITNFAFDYRCVRANVMHSHFQQIAERTTRCPRIVCRAGGTGFWWNIFIENWILNLYLIQVYVYLFRTFALLRWALCSCGSHYTIYSYKICIYIEIHTWNSRTWRAHME